MNKDHIPTRRRTLTEIPVQQLGTPQGENGIKSGELRKRKNLVGSTRGVRWLQATVRSF